MSDELRAWADNVSREIRHYLTDHRHPDITAGASVLRRVDVLTAKVKELAGALEVYADPNRWEIAYDVDTGDIADDRHVFVTDESEPWGVAKSALRTRGGGGV